MDPAQTRTSLASTLNVDLSARVIQLARLGVRLQCPGCSHPLDLHQPDERVPENLLATCETCSQWYLLIELGKHGRELLLLALPTMPVIEEFVQKSRSAAE